jgi:hypothetical protein
MAVVEASQVIHDLPEGKCPLCTRPFSDGEMDGSPHEEFERACIKEIQKIDALQAGLRESIADFTNEESELRGRSHDLATDLQKLDGRLRSVLTPQVRTVEADLRSMIQRRTQLAQGEVLRSAAKGLEDRLERIRTARSEKIPKSSFENRATTSIAFEFCQVVEGILRAWKYPDLGAISFDTTKADLVIGGQDRANKGKGYRAVTYAAFAIGLMKYCRAKNIPHPGFVILDTPMNPFKGPDATSPEKVTDDVKESFYEYLANDKSGDQVIIMENEEPPDQIRQRVNYYHFSKNVNVNRYGFFPVAKDQSGGE